MNTIKIYMSHENEDIVNQLASLLLSFGYIFFCQGKERHITRIEFKKEGP